MDKMNKQKDLMSKGKYRKFLILIPVAIVVGVMYMLFWNRRKELLDQLKHTNQFYFAIIILLGILYEVFDAIPYMLFVKKKIKKYSLWDAVKNSYIGIFLNVTTLGTGIKPGQTFILCQKGVEPGNAFGILTVPYIFHKLAIVIYATIVLIFNNKYIINTFSDTVHYLYAGYGLSLLVIIGIIIACTCKKAHEIVFYPFDKHLKNERIIMVKDVIKRQLRHLADESSDILKDYRNWIFSIVIYLIKMTCWYTIPFVALKAVGADFNVSLVSVVSTSAFMLLIVGVIPVVGGIGPAEVVYVLLFTVVFGKIEAGSTMILYRIATYYLPFIIGTIISGFGIKKISDGNGNKI